MLICPSLGGLKENSLGAAASFAAKALGWLEESGPVSRLDRYSKAVEWSPIAVGPNLTREWESSSGGRTPTARHGRWKSLSASTSSVFTWAKTKHILVMIVSAWHLCARTCLSRTCSRVEIGSLWPCWRWKSDLSSQSPVGAAFQNPRSAARQYTAWDERWQITKFEGLQLPFNILLQPSHTGVWGTDSNNNIAYGFFFLF